MVLAAVFQWGIFILIAFLVAAMIAVPIILLSWYFKIRSIKKYAEREHKRFGETDKGTDGKEPDTGEGTEDGRPDNDDGRREDIQIPSPPSTGRDKGFNRIFSE